MRKMTSIRWGVLLASAIGSVSVAWALAAGSRVPLFDSPVSPPPPSTPGWVQIQMTPTPRPQPVVLPDVTAGPATLTTGLRGYWHLDEADTGDRADSSPIGSNTLTNINGVSWTASGHTGNASDFESSNYQYLKIESNQAVGLNFSHSFTLAGWIKRESTGSHMILAARYSFGTGINDRAYRFQLYDDKLRLIVSPDGTYDSAYSVVGGTSLISTTNWYHVAAVFDAGAQQLKLYLNGSLDADKAVSYDTVFQSNAPFMLGADMSDGAAEQFFDGLMDEWRVYHRALSQSEIQALMNE